MLTASPIFDGQVWKMTQGGTWDVDSAAAWNSLLTNRKRHEKQRVASLAWSADGEVSAEG